MKRYRAKPNTWFDEGTEVEILDVLSSIWDDLDGVYIMTVCAVGLKNGKLDEEICMMDEFEEINE